MSHGSNEPDADESRREHARAGYQCLGCKQTWSSVTSHSLGLWPGRGQGWKQLWKL